MYGNQETRSFGTGQGTTTRAFGETDGTLYAGGGGGYSGGAGGGGNGDSWAGGGTDGGANTGGGGGGAAAFSGVQYRRGHCGGSGIAIIRW